MATNPFMRRAHLFSDEDFRTLWSSVRELAVIGTLDDHGKAQGSALVHLDQLYQADADGAFAKLSYIACSDPYYQWWVDHDMGPNVFHHFCRHDTLKACMAKTGREGIVHVLQWAPLTRPEAEGILKSWGLSTSLLGRAPRKLPGPVPGKQSDSHGRAKAGPVRPPPGLEGERPPILRSRRQPAESDQEEADDDDEDATERHARKSKMARPVSPPPPPAKKTRPVDAGGAALDKMLDADPYDVDSDKLRGEAHARLATLREDLQRRKTEKAKSEPGAILANRAAAVAENSGKIKGNRKVTR